MISPSDIVVLTAVADAREILTENHASSGERFCAFSVVNAVSCTWDVRPLAGMFKSPLRNLLLPKTSPHLYVQGKASLWITSHVSLRVPAADIVNDWLADADIGVFYHQKRTSIFDEAVRLAIQGVDDIGVITEQMTKYRSLGVSPEVPLPRTLIVARRHNRAVEEFNVKWWAEISRYSARDVLSFMYAAHCSGVKVNIVNELPSRYMTEVKRFHTPHIW